MILLHLSLLRHPSPTVPSYAYGDGFLVFEPFSAVHQHVENKFFDTLSLTKAYTFVRFSMYRIAELAYNDNRHANSIKGAIKLNNYSYAYPPAKAQIGFGKAPGSDFFYGKTTSLPKDPQLAMAYVPFQTDFTLYDEMKGLKAGTLFPCLDKPFHGCGHR